jgi:hypothetical protein
MKSFLAFALLLLLAPLCIAQGQIFTYDGWLQIEREISEGTAIACGSGAGTGACHDTGAISGATGSPQTKVTLTLKNIGTADREGIILTESLSYVPQGVKVSFFNAPSETDGRSANWEIGAIPAGESKSVSYSLAASLAEGQQARMFPPSFTAEQLSVVLSAPVSSQAGSRISLSLMSQSGQPVSNATIFVHFPDGATQAVKTGEQGTASVIASTQGFYTYSAMGYRLLRVSSTEAIAAPEQGGVPETSAAASSAGTGVVGSIIGFLPTLAAMLAVIFILIMAYNFISSRREEGGEAGTAHGQGQPQQAAQSSNGAGFVYTQKFSFAEDAKREERVREVTHGVLESRKRQMSGAGSQPAEGASERQGEAQAQGQGEELKEEKESTLGEDDVEESLQRLESEARQEGEAAEEDEGEDSLEATIAKLEEIRQRLRERQSSAPAENEIEGKGAEAEEEPEIEKPSPISRKQKSRAPSARKAKPAPKSRTKRR